MRLKTVSLILFFALLLALSTYAQEPVEPLPTVEEPTSPPATETPIPTEIPLPTATATPSLTPTVTSTDTGIPAFTETPITTATSELTLSPTGSSAFTATPTPSLTASLQPTFDPFATLEVPFTTQIYDNFDNGALAIWQIGAGWSLVPNESGLALQAQNTVEPMIMDDDTLYNASIQVRVLLNAGAIPSATSLRLFLRQSELGEYAATLDTDGNISLYRGTELIGSAQVAASLPGQWRTFRFSVVEDLLRIWVDDVEIGSLSDKSPLPPGRVGFSAEGKENIALTVDDVVVAWEAVMLSSLELQSTETPTPNQTCVPNWEYTFVFNTAGELYGWELTEGAPPGADVVGEFVGTPGSAGPHRITMNYALALPQNSTLTSVAVRYYFDQWGGSGRYVSITAFGTQQYWNSSQFQSVNPGWVTWTGNKPNQSGTITVVEGDWSNVHITHITFKGTGVNPFNENPGCYVPTYTPTPTLTPSSTPSSTPTPTLTPTMTATNIPPLAMIDCGFVPFSPVLQTDDENTSVDEGEYSIDSVVRLSPEGDAQPPNFAFFGVKVNSTTKQPIDPEGNPINVTQWDNLSIYNLQFLQAPIRRNIDRKFTPLGATEPLVGGHRWILISYNGSLGWMRGDLVDVSDCPNHPLRIYVPTDLEWNLEVYFQSLLDASEGADAAPDPSDWAPFGECTGTSLDSDRARCSYKLYEAIYAYFQAKGTPFTLGDILAIVLLNEWKAEFPSLAANQNGANLTQPQRYILEAAARNMAQVCAQERGVTPTYPITCNIKGVSALLLQVHSLYALDTLGTISDKTVEKALGLELNSVSYSAYATAFNNEIFTNNTAWASGTSGAGGAVPAQWGNYRPGHVVYTTVNDILNGTQSLPSNVFILQGLNWIYVDPASPSPLLLSAAFAINRQNSDTCRISVAVTVINHPFGQTESCPRPTPAP